MQVVIFLIGLMFITVNRQDEALYLLFELDDYHEETLEGSHSPKIFSFRIDKLSDSYKEYIDPLNFQPSKTNRQIESLPNNIKDINWLRKEYIKAFENFTNDPVGIGEDGKVLVFNLKRDYSKIFIITKENGAYCQVEVTPIEIIE
ncbi:MAG: hypothetical protein ACJAS3_000988 [Roseivirga sp.]|jgi:hypothetical protein